MGRTSWVTEDGWRQGALFSVLCRSGPCRPYRPSCRTLRQSNSEAWISDDDKWRLYVLADEMRATALRRKAGCAEGATAIEYAIMVMLIAMAIIFAVYLVGQEVTSTYECTREHVANTPNDPSAVTCP